MEVLEQTYYKLVNIGTDADEWLPSTFESFRILSTALDECAVFKRITSVA